MFTILFFIHIFTPSPYNFFYLLYIKTRMLSATLSCLARLADEERPNDKVLSSLRGDVAAADEGQTFLEDKAAAGNKYQVAI